jgi:hypothetical protein
MIDHLPVRIRGQRYTPRKLTQTKKRYIWISEEEVLFIPPIPLLIVEAENPARVSANDRVSTGDTPRSGLT